MKYENNIKIVFFILKYILKLCCSAAEGRRAKYYYFSSRKVLKRYLK